jgi:hypothetical protein
MIRIEIDDREVRQALEDLRRRVSNMKPAMHTIGQALMAFPAHAGIDPCRG